MNVVFVVLLFGDFVVILFDCLENVKKGRKIWRLVVCFDGILYLWFGVGILFFLF